MSAAETAELLPAQEPAHIVPPDAPEVGQLAALTIEQCCNAAAQRVLAAANDFSTLNAQVQEEAKLLADQIVAEGKRWAEFMTSSTTLAKTIHSTLSGERERIRSFVRDNGEKSDERSDAYSG